MTCPPVHRAHAATRIRAVLILAIGAWALPAAAVSIAVPRAAQSVELKVAWSALVVRGVVTAHRPSSVEGESFATLALQVSETLKGPVKTGETIAVITRNVGSLPWFEHGRAGREYVFFLVAAENVVHERMPTPAQAAMWRTAPWAIPDYAHNPPVPLFGKVDLPLFAYTGNYKVAIDDPAAALAALRGETAAAVRYGRGQISLSLTGDRQAEPGVRELKIPIDPRGPATTARWAQSGDPLDGLNACNVLEHFKSDQSIVVLKSLLEDSFLSDDPYWPGGFWIGIGMGQFDMGEGKWASRPYPVRQRAWRILQKWKAAPTTATIAQFRYQPRLLESRWVVVAAIALLLPMIAVMLRPRANAQFRPRHFAGFSGVSFMLLLIVAGLWAASAWWTFDLSVPHGPGSRFEMALIRGRLRLMWIDSWNDPSPALISATRNTPAVIADWGEGPGRPAPQRQFAGFEVDATTIRLYGANAGVTRIFRIPLWAAMLPFAILPLLAVRRRLRYRQRLQRRACVRCGYDLRASPDRCPECGTTPS